MWWLVPMLVWSRSMCLRAEIAGGEIDVVGSVGRAAVSICLVRGR